ncbi:MAG: L-seryl-tRNA(Sec) selenium transferase [Acidimicrobiales bacterium]
MADSRPPSVDVLARSIADIGLPHPLLVDAARAAVAAGDPTSARTRAEATRRALLGPVINATGVLLHTNLGRAPLAVSHDATYTNLELDLETGRRGSRRTHAGALLARVCGADTALVVNNGAAGVLLVLAALARGRGVAVSRGELVEIGGGFRVPDVMAESGARLVEVGTTNRTRPADYERAIAEPATDVALVLKVHQSNYRITGFTEAAEVAEVADLGPPLVADLGSGLLDAACPWLPYGPPPWLRDEPAVRQTLAAGAGLVVFSGDKLLGGPQGGIVAGRSDLVDACARHSLYRAMRPGALVLRAMQEVALAYLRRDGASIPFWRMVTTPVEILRDRAEKIAADVDGWRIVDCVSVTGGGTLPGIEIPSAGLTHGHDVTAALRAGHPPVIARVGNRATIIDLRTVDPADDETLAASLRAPVPIASRTNPRQ